jgi:hypothetical protein
MVPKGRGNYIAAFLYPFCIAVSGEDYAKMGRLWLEMVSLLGTEGCATILLRLSFRIFLRTGDICQKKEEGIRPGKWKKFFVRGKDIGDGAVLVKL